MTEEIDDSIEVSLRANILFHSFPRLGRRITPIFCGLTEVLTRPGMRTPESWNGSTLFGEGRAGERQSRPSSLLPVFPQTLMRLFLKQVTLSELEQEMRPV